MELTPGTIYLADHRGITESELFTRWSTLNYGTYQNAERQAFGALLTLNDEVFMPGYEATYKAGQNLWAVIIPITGEVAYTDAGSQWQTLDVGQVQVSYVQAGNSIKLKNDYKNDRINFLYLEFAADELGKGTGQQFSFDFEGQENQLIPVVELPAFALHIAMFQGREEALYQMQSNDTVFYAFVIAGAFELQGRLLHQRDGLGLWNVATADMEALSNNAVILVMEIKKQV